MYFTSPSEYKTLLIRKTRHNVLLNITQNISKLIIGLKQFLFTNGIY